MLTDPPTGEEFVESVKFGECWGSSLHTGSHAEKETFLCWIFFMCTHMLPGTAVAITPWCGDKLENRRIQDPEGISEPILGRLKLAM